MLSDEKFKSNHNQTWVIVAPCDPSFIGGVQGHMYAPKVTQGHLKVKLVKLNGFILNLVYGHIKL